MRRPLRHLWLVVVAVLAWPATADAADVVAGEVVVRFKDGVAPAERAAVRRSEGATLDRSLRLAGLQVLRVAGSVGAAVRRLEQHAQVAYAEPNAIYRLSVVPNDPRFDELWGLDNIGQETGWVADADTDAPEAWEHTTGSGGPVVGVVDTGTAHDHVDLAQNIYSNSGETGAGKESNGQDDDDNGYIDDHRGWDFVAADNDPDDVHSHGTHVAGTIGARGNNGVGIAGVNWTARLAPLRVCGSNGLCTSDRIAEAFRYAGRNGMRVANASLGGPERSTAVEEAINASPGTLFVIAAGNGSDDLNAGVNSYPCEFGAVNVLCVAASTPSDGLASFSNYGATSVDLAAPGTGILSSVLSSGTAASDAYEAWSGTSMATPHVAGIVALLMAEDPAATTGEIRDAVLAGVDARPAFAGKTVTGGRANADGALETLLAADPAPPQGNPEPPGSAAQPLGSAPQQSQAPGPAPATAPAVQPAVLAVGSRVGRRQRLGTVLRRGLLVEVISTRPGGARIDVLVGANAGRRLGLASGLVRLGRRHVSIKAGRTRLRVKLTRHARLRLARARSARVLVRTVVQSGSERESTKLRAVSLRR